MARKNPQIKLYISTSGREYVKMYGRTYKCCRKNMPHPIDWVWIPEVKRWVCSKCF